MLSSMRALLILTVLCAVPLISAEDLVPDPALQSERLPNGMRLAVQAQAQPPGRVVLRLLVTAGSLAEREDERGLAHFLEHAAFLGSSTFPDGSLVPHMQALGLAFGAHTNAHTSYDETVYKLELPAVDAGTIDTGLAVMADWAGGLTFPAAAIERERGVVLAEMRDRDTPGLRRWLALSQLLYAGTTLPRRHPIGDEGVLRASGAAQLRALYEGVYRPERMALVVVGDIDAAAVLAAARTRFTALTGHGPERPQVAPGMLEAGVAAAVHHDAEADGTEVLIALVRPWTRPADSIAQRRLELEQELAERVLTRRLQRLVDSDPATPFLKPEVFSSPWAGFFSAGVTAQARPGAVLATARVLEVERRRLLAFGPLPGELATAADEMRTALAQAVAQAGTRTSAKMADSIYESIRDRRVWMSPLQQQQLALPLLAQATTAAVTSAAQVIWAEGRMAIFAGGREDLGAGCVRRWPGPPPTGPTASCLRVRCPRPRPCCPMASSAGVSPMARCWFIRAARVSQDRWWYLCACICRPRARRREPPRCSHGAGSPVGWANMIAANCPTCCRTAACVGRVRPSMSRARCSQAPACPPICRG